ncbi:MAG TPA: hypothetical protein PLC03_16270 [Microthrixaceae bacterium]|nr:hypothetical protein [Microthrixaceae bacterium]
MTSSGGRPMRRAELYRDPQRKWRYRIIAGNNRVVDASEQGFRSKWWARKRLRRDWGEIPLKEIP